MAPKSKPKKGAKTARKALRLGDLPLSDPRVLKVLDRHGVHLCAGCMMTLTATLGKVAAYHAVPDAEAFIRDLKRAIKS